VLILSIDSDISGETMNICCCIDGVRDTIGMLGDHCSHDTGEDISAAALGHTGISRCVNRYCPAWMRDKGTPSF